MFKGLREEGLVYDTNEVGQRVRSRTGEKNHLLEVQGEENSKSDSRVNNSCYHRQSEDPGASLRRDH